MMIRFFGHLLTSRGPLRCPWAKHEPGEGAGSNLLSSPAQRRPNLNDDDAHCSRISDGLENCSRVRSLVFGEDRWSTNECNERSEWSFNRYHICLLVFWSRIIAWYLAPFFVLFICFLWVCGTVPSVHITRLSSFRARPPAALQLVSDISEVGKRGWWRFFSFIYICSWCMTMLPCNILSNSRSNPDQRW